MAKTLKENFAETLKMHQEATERHNSNAFMEIFDRYCQHLNQAPEEPAILFSLGAVCKQLGYNGLAIALLEKSLRLKESSEGWNNLGAAYKAEFDHENAERCWRKAIELRPYNADYYLNLSTLYINEGNPRPGLEPSSKAIELDPGNMKAWWNRSLLLLEDGQWEEGFRAYDAGLITMDRVPRIFDRENSIPEWKGEDIKGKTIVVYGEQGLGDEIMFASAIPDLIATGAKVIYECHPRLEGVTRRSFPDLFAVYPTRKDVVLEWPDDHEIDYKVAIGSLFRWFRSDGNFPCETYYVPDPNLVAEYKKWLAAAGPGPHIGFGWAGGSKKTHGSARSLQLNPMKSVLSQPATFVSLQYTPEADGKVLRFYKDSGIRIHHWPEVVRELDYDHTIALIAALDLVIAINTTVVHVCGALGKECWTLTPDRCAWRYAQGGEHMVMYGDWVRQYRENGSMDEAIAAVAWRLGVILDERAAS